MDQGCQSRPVLQVIARNRSLLLPLNSNSNTQMAVKVVRRAHASGPHGPNPTRFLPQALVISGNSARYEFNKSVLSEDACLFRCILTPPSSRNGPATIWPLPVRANTCYFPHTCWCCLIVAGATFSCIYWAASIVCARPRQNGGRVGSSNIATELGASSNKRHLKLYINTHIITARARSAMEVRSVPARRLRKCRINGCTFIAFCCDCWVWCTPCQ